jgi:hypothetical protein
MITVDEAGLDQAKGRLEEYPPAGWAQVQPTM